MVNNYNIEARGGGWTPIKVQCLGSENNNRINTVDLTTTTTKHNLAQRLLLLKEKHLMRSMKKIQSLYILFTKDVKCDQTLNQ